MTAVTSPVDQPNRALVQSLPPAVTLPHTSTLGSAAAAAKEPRRKFVVFALDAQHYCVDIMSVREIRMAQTITYIPGAPKLICGVINLRGSIVPVCDLRARFGGRETVLLPTQRIVITMIGGRAIGLLVDDVLDILAIPEIEISPVPQADGDNDRPLFRGLISHNGTMLILVETENLIDPLANVPAN